MRTTSPARGEVWMVDFDPTKGHEQAGRRPALVISVDIFNSGPAELVIVLPITSKSKGVRSHVEVNPPEAGLTVKSFIKCEDVRSVAKERLSRRRGRVLLQTMAAVEYRVRILLGL
jgi:mRNA interferase MazF